MSDFQDNPEAFYASKPWLKEYGPGVPTEFQPLSDRNMPELIRRCAQKYGDKTAFTICLDSGMNASLTYGETDRYSDELAAYLRYELGLGKGDRVAVQMPNCLAYPVSAFGTLKAGCVLVNVNPLYTAREMNHQLKDSGARVLIIIDMFADKLEKALAGTQVEKVLLVGINAFFPAMKRALVSFVLKRVRKLIPRTTVAATRLAAALAAGRRHVGTLRSDPPGLAPGDTAVLQYTGGTTGVAKGAELTHDNLLSNISQIYATAGPILHEGKETVLTALPLYHIFAFTFNLMIFYVAGGRNILCPSPRPPSNLRKPFEQFRVTKFSAVNILFAGLLQEPWFRDSPPTSIDLSVAGGTALHRSVAEQWQQLVGSKIAEGYGLSETSPVVTLNPPQGEIRVGTIGVPAPGTDVRIVDERGNLLPPGRPGELQVQGPQVMHGYWHRPDETDKVLKDGWFSTGDMAVIDERGYITIVDRKKDMIDVSGFNVYPNEVEETLSAHPKIAEAAVVGVPQPEGGEKVRAYVVSRDGNLTEDDVIRFARESLTAYKVPKEVVFRDDLPKTPVGKILRKDLRQETETQASGQQTDTRPAGSAK